MQFLQFLQFERVNALLASRSTGRGKRKGRPEYLLTGILRRRPGTRPCPRPWPPAAVASATAAASAVRSHCPTGLLVADEIDSAVIARVEELARHSDLKRQVLVDLARGEASVAHRR